MRAKAPAESLARRTRAVRLRVLSSNVQVVPVCVWLMLIESGL
jgi:hypothetical protein